jgi:selenocysteine lyase/cysteine desulfurase
MRMNGQDYWTRVCSDEALRAEEFPIVRHKIFLAHAAVTALPARVTRALHEYVDETCQDMQETAGIMRRVKETREVAARMIGGKASEIALLGPTSLGISLFANGLDWSEGDEVLCYLDDYPANVYPWLNLRRRGVTVRFLEPEVPGAITPELVARSLGPKTRLVALASCHFLSGRRIDIDAIGALLHERGVLFSLDAIQTIGAFPTSVKHVDFLSADAHKWMLGPMGMGIVFVKEEHQERLRPTLLGSWNVKSPGFISQPDIVFEPTARRYEPGALNFLGILGMKAGLELLEDAGTDWIAGRLLELGGCLSGLLRDCGFQVLSVEPGDPMATGIVSVTLPGAPAVALEKMSQFLVSQNVVHSCRRLRDGTSILRFSPHFYNTFNELDQVASLLHEANS